MVGLTSKQAQLLEFVGNYMAEHNGVAPSFDEMRVGIGLASKSGVHVLISALVERGHMAHMRNRARSLSVLRNTPSNVAHTLMLASDEELLQELERRSNLRAAAA